MKIRTKTLYYFGTIFGIFVVCPAFVALVHYNSNEFKDIETGRTFLLYFTPITSAFIIGMNLLFGPVLSLECCDETVTVHRLARHRQVIPWEDILRIEVKGETFRSGKYHTTENNVVLLLFLDEENAIRMCFSENQIKKINDFLRFARERVKTIAVPGQE